MKRNITLIGMLCISFAVGAQSSDYSTGNSNPLSSYDYITPQEQALLLSSQDSRDAPRQGNGGNNATRSSHQVEGSYFTNNIANPKAMVIEQGTLPSNGKYKHLQNNANSLHGCWDSAARIYRLDPWLLMAIAKVESSFNSRAINVNTNNSVDVGMMQINTIWLPTLRKFGITQQDLLNPCTSVFVGAWIVAQNIRNFGYNPDGIGAYNSPRNVTIRRAYAGKVYKAYSELVSELYYKRK